MTGNARKDMLIYKYAKLCSQSIGTVQSPYIYSSSVRATQMDQANLWPKIQYAQPPNDTVKLPPKGQQQIQSIVGKFLYYGRAVDPTVLTALGEISTSQAAPTEDAVKKASMLMDYLHIFPNIKLRFYVQLHIEFNAAYLVIPETRSCTVQYFYLSATSTPNKTYKRQFNAPIHTECRTITNVVSSTVEAECTALFHNC